MRVITPTPIVENTQFSRASTATYFDSNGILQTAAVDELRVNFNPATLKPTGILTEGEATNLLPHSNGFTNSPWSRTGTLSTGFLSPDGTGNAFLLTEVEAPATATRVQALNFFNVTQGQILTGSIFAKENELFQKRFVRLFFGGAFTNAIGSLFDLATGQTSLRNGANVIATHYQKLPNGYVRIGITCLAPSSGLVNFDVSLFNSFSAGLLNYIGDGVSGMYFYGAQVEIVNTPTSYIPTTTAIVTRAADILGDALTSNIPEPDPFNGEQLWNAATSYTVGQEVIRRTTHRIYRNIQGGINSTLPEVDAALPEPTRWVEIGVTNRFSMFDTLRSTASGAVSPIAVAIKAGKRVNSIGVLGLFADLINIRMVANGVEVYNYTENLDTRTVNNWSDYFFEEFSNKSAIVRFDLPPFSQADIFVTISSRTGIVKCGAVVLGNFTDIGQLLYGARIGANNFSRIDRAFDGTAQLLQRQTKPKVSGVTFFDKQNTNKILALKTSLNAIPAVWCGLNENTEDPYFDGLLILGIYKLFDVDVAYPEQARLEIEVEEI